MVRGLKSRLKMLSRVFVRNRFLLSVGLSVASGLVVRSVIQIPDSDPLLRYAAFERPAMYQAFIVSYALFLFTTPFLLLSLCLSLIYIHFYEEQIQQAAGLVPPYPKPEFRKELFLILGELHEQIEAVPAAHPKWLNIPERGLYTGIAALGAIGSGKTRGLIRKAADEQDAKRFLELVSQINDLLHEKEMRLRNVRREALGYIIEADHRALAQGWRSS